MFYDKWSSWLVVFVLFCATVLLKRCVAIPYHFDMYVEPKCLDMVSGRELFVGETFTRSGQCISIQCLVNLQVWEDRCQVPKLKGNCHPIPSANEFLDYPKCCPMFECKTIIEGRSRETKEITTYDHHGNLRSTYITQVFTIADPINGKAPHIRTQFRV